MKPLYGGIDLHANNSVIVVLDEEDQIVYRKRLPNDLEPILLQLAPYRAQLQGLVVESTFNWYWLVDGLMDAGYLVHLANTTAIQQYTGLKYTDDDTDARLAVPSAAPRGAPDRLHLSQGRTRGSGFASQA